MKFSFGEKALLYRELAKLSSSGFGLGEAVDTVVDTRPPNATLAVLRGVKSGLAQAKTISQSFADVRDVELSALESSIIEASERGGVLEEGFDHLANYFSMREKNSKTMRRKMFYPLFLLHFAIVIPLVPLLIGSPNPGRVVLISALTLLAAYAVLFIVLFIGRRMSTKAETNPKTDRKLARVPLVGNLRQNLSLARFTSVFRMHLLSGERIDEGLRSAAKASRSGRIVEAIEKSAIPAVLDGKPVGPELTKHPKVFTSTFARGFTTAETAGKLDNDLLRWTKHFQDDAESAMHKLGTHGPKYFGAFIIIIALTQIYRMVMKIFSGYGEVFKFLGL